MSQELVTWNYTPCFSNFKNKLYVWMFNFPRLSLLFRLCSLKSVRVSLYHDTVTAVDTCVHPPCMVHPMHVLVVMTPSLLSIFYESRLI